jgi:cyclophilin family peptidyl-prolyl cis-trans isomerase
MFKENKNFWRFFAGIIVLFFLVYSVLRSGFNTGSLNFSGFPFSLLNSNSSLYISPAIEFDISKNYEALIKTNLGEFTIDLYEKNAPNTVTNFINLANSGYYESTTFYRIVPNLLIQGGSSTTKNSDPNDDIYGGPGYVIPDEINWDSLDYSSELKAELTKSGYKSSTRIASKDLVKYSVGMANNGPDKAGSQFFIIVAESSNPILINMRGKYTVFGGVTEGSSLVDKISQMEVNDSNKNLIRPKAIITIEKITIHTK